jgi:hypothetical protein
MDQGKVNHDLMIIGRYDNQVSLVKHDPAEGLRNRELMGIGLKLLRICGLNGHKYQGSVS